MSLLFLLHVVSNITEDGTIFLLMETDLWIAWMHQEFFVFPWQRRSGYFYSCTGSDLQRFYQTFQPCNSKIWFNEQVINNILINTIRADTWSLKHSIWHSPHSFHPRSLVWSIKLRSLGTEVKTCRRSAKKKKFPTL